MSTANPERATALHPTRDGSPHPVESVVLDDGSGSEADSGLGMFELLPDDWPLEGPIDLEVHDLPHTSSTTEWWYLNTHVESLDGRAFSLFASFFRVLKGRDEESGALSYAHSLTWALTDVTTETYYAESRVDKGAPSMGLEKLDRGEGTSDPRIRRAAREVLAKGRVPYPDQVFAGEVFVGTRRLDLDFDGQCFRRLDNGAYALKLFHDHHKVGCDLVFTPSSPAIRHGRDGVVKGTHGEDMFYYFVPQCAVTGTLNVEGGSLPIAKGRGWYDHEFGRHGHDLREGQVHDVAWNWLAVQFSDGRQLSAYTLVDEHTQAVIDERAIVVAADGTPTYYDHIAFEAENLWRSTRTFQEYPTRWRLQVPDAGLDLKASATFDDQEFVTLISKPAFWEGRIDVAGTLAGLPVTGIGYLERSGFSNIETLEDFFASVGREVRKSVAAVAPLDPSFERVLDLIGTAERPDVMRGVDIPTFTDHMIRPVREIADRGGKSWRSYAALACCDIVGGDSRDFVQWLALPEFMHVGSLIVDDIQDKSEVRRGGQAAHLIYGEPVAINAGTAAYFMGQKLLTGPELSSADKLRLYDLYFEALRAGHAGQALDLAGLDDAMAQAAETGRCDTIEARVLAIHRLKTAVPAASLARMGAVAGGGTEVQIEGLGGFFEAVGTAFQIMDDVLNLRGFEGDLKARGEDIAQGKATSPVVKAMTLLDADARRALWPRVQAKPQGAAEVREIIAIIEGCGALDACVTQANELVDEAWRVLDPLVEDSLPKIMLRAFGWFVLQRHY
jgi:geranylgeranyl pyrophosphate synthase/predicted secreted hydrolase